MDNSKMVVEVYEKIASEYAQKFNQPSEHIDDFIALLQSEKKVLDVGCGPGIDARYLQGKGCKVTGIDLSKNMIKIAKKNVKEANFKVEDMRKMSFPSNYFNGVFIAYSLIHIPKTEVKEVLNKTYTMLKKGGVVYVAVQAGESNEMFVPEPLNPKEQIFLNIVSKNEIEWEIENAGFSIVKDFERNAKKHVELNFTKLFILARK